MIEWVCLHKRPLVFPIFDIDRLMFQNQRYAPPALGRALLGCHRLGKGNIAALWNGMEKWTVVLLPGGCIQSLLHKFLSFARSVGYIHSMSGTLIQYPQNIFSKQKQGTITVPSPLWVMFVAFGGFKPMHFMSGNLCVCFFSRYFNII